MRDVKYLIGLWSSSAEPTLLSEVFRCIRPSLKLQLGSGHLWAQLLSLVSRQYITIRVVASAASGVGAAVALALVAS